MTIAFALCFYFLALEELRCISSVLCRTSWTSRHSLASHYKQPGKHFSRLGSWLCYTSFIISFKNEGSSVKVVFKGKKQQSNTNSSEAWPFLRPFSSLLITILAKQWSFLSLLMGESKKQCIIFFPSCCLICLSETASTLNIQMFWKQLFCLMFRVFN